MWIKINENLIKEWKKTYGQYCKSMDLEPVEGYRDLAELAIAKAVWSIRDSLEANQGEKHV